jgi:hypothetical protein
MKKLLFLALAVLLSMNMAHALLPSFGVKGGLNMAKYSGSDAGTTDYKMGIAGGAFVCLDLIALKIQPEMLFSQKGAKEKGSIGGVSYSGSVTANYVEIPVLAKFSFGKIIVPSVYVGPAFGMLMNANAEVTLGGVSSGSVDVKDAYNGTDLGLVFGAEVKLPVKLSVEARYNMGLKTIAKEYTNALGQTVKPDVKNSTVSVMLGYYLF